MAITYKYSHLVDVMNHFGGTITSLAKVLGVSAPSTCVWLEQGYLPANRAIQVERITNGLFKAIDLAK